MTDTIQTTFTLPYDIDAALLTGASDELLREVENSFDAHLLLRGDVFTIEGDEVEVRQITALLTELIGLLKGGEMLDVGVVRRTIQTIRQAQFAPQTLREDVILSHHGTTVRPQTVGQKRYVDAIRAHTITFAIGPAGTGKTYLAVALALAALNRREVGRVVLTRPIVEAGENLGFLPGTLTEKVDPYIRPLYDALYCMADFERVNQMVEDGVIEIAPLAFMRGRTLNESFIILDEAQNTTYEQMKMFLTRLGMGSKIVVTGDVSQIDLPRGTSGLMSVEKVLEGIEDIAFCRLTGKDVVRHSLVAEIIAAYDRAEGKV